MAKVNIKHYTYRVIWSLEDEEHIGLCTEFPSLSYLDEDQVTALKGIVNLVEQVIVDMEANGETIPEPLVEKKYSGKFQLRTTPELHRELTIRAAEEGVSLNRYVNTKLTA